jgi:hypothetical protein
MKLSSLLILGVLLLGVLLLPCGFGLRAARGADILVNTYTTGNQAGGRVAIDGDGNFVVIWGSAQNDPASDVFAQRFDSRGNKLGPEFQVNASTTGTQYAYGVASDAAGDFVVIWGATDGSDRGIFGRRFDSAGAALGTEFQINTFTTGEQFAPSVSSDAAGSFVVVWSSAGQDGSVYGVFGQRYDSGGSPAGTEFPVNTYTTGGQYLAAVASGAAGDFVAVWSSIGQDGFGHGVFGQRFDSDGSPAGTEFQVNTATAYNQYFADVAVDADGDFVVVWDDGNEVLAQRYQSSGAAAGSEFRVNTFDSNSQEFPEVAVDDDGNFVVAWGSEAQDGGGWGVFAQRYDAGGQSVGTEFRVNSATTQNEEFPDVAAAPNGDFVVTWNAREHDGSESGVFAKQYIDGVVACDPTPDPSCESAFTKGLLLLKEKPGSEKLILKMAGNAQVSQAGYGNPLIAGGTAYRLCIYDDAPQLVADVLVDQGGASSWSPLGSAPPDPFGKGYKYRDSGGSADGIGKIVLQAGPASGGTSKIQIKGRGSALPLPIASGLTSTTAVTVQLRGDDAPGAGCFSATLHTIRRQTAQLFKAK